ncbi:MAG: exodeoxyribonuclease V subunit gamma [Waddliaceae bacterium]
MSHQFRVFFSNRIERLYVHLIKELFSEKTSAFTKRTVVVPSLAIKNWLRESMARDLGIAAGVHMTFLEQAIEELRRDIFAQDRLSHLVLAFRIEAEIQRILSSFSSLPDQQIWAPLHNYLRCSSRQKTERRLVRLSAKLARLFQEYETFGGSMLRRWLMKNEGEWQGELWRRVAGKAVSDKNDFAPGDRMIHLFANSFIPRKHYQFLVDLSQNIPVNLFVLSPCQLFWSDILSDREGRKWQKRWEERSVSEQQQEEMEAYLYDRNPLLANAGRLGREMAAQIEETPCQTEEDDYQEPQEEQGLLKWVQADMLSLRSPDPAAKIAVAEDDRSIQLHAAASPMREIQVLYNNLMAMIDKHANDPHPVLPEDVLVMAPDIDDYVPYIRAVFRSKESQLNYRIMGISLLAHNRLIQGFFHLISIAFGRWDVASLVHLLNFPPFLERHRLTSDDALQIRTWMKEAKVRWGESAEHRLALLRRHYEEGAIVDDRPFGTWEHGFERLLMGLAMTPVENGSWPLLPAADIETTQAELLGQWMRLVRSLRADLKPLSDGSTMTLSEWSGYLLNLLNTYFSANSSDADDLLRLVQSLKITGNAHSFPFSSIWYHLEEGAARQRVREGGSSLHAVRFCSLQSPHPAKIIALLGMQQGSFPRQEAAFSLNALRESEDADYCPTQADKDRYLFLETLLSARESVILSYHDADQTAAPSLLAAELFSYLDKGYTVGGNLPSHHCCFTHPLHPHDKVYFSRHRLQSYSHAHYRAAQAFYNGAKRAKHCFIPDFHITRTPRVPEEQTIDLKQLQFMASKPIEAFFRRTLGIYLETDDKRVWETEEDFLLSPLERAILRKRAMKRPIEEVLKEAEKEGRLPLGPFHRDAVNQLKIEADALNQACSQLMIHPSDIVTIECAEQYDAVEQTETGGWRLPPLEVPYENQKVKIVGVLEEVAPNGMIAHIKHDKIEIIKVWPLYLVYRCLTRHYALPLSDQLLFMKSGKGKTPMINNPLQELQRYLHYYFHALENASPLIPDWLPALIEHEAKHVEKKIHDSFSQQSRHFYHHDLKWAMHGSDLPDTKIIVNEWKKIAEQLYGQLYKTWM